MNTPEEMDAEVRESWRARVAAVTADTVNEKDRDGRAWLSNAIVWVPEIDSIQRLLDLGADVNAADHRRWTPLHFAAQERHPDIARLLIQKGALVDPTDKFGNTPLGNATYGQEGLDMMRLLVDAGADPDRKNDYGNSPLDLARQTGDAEKLAILGAGPKAPEATPVGSSEHLEEEPEVEKPISAEPVEVPSPEEEEPLTIALSEQAASEDFFEIPHVDEQAEELPSAQQDEQLAALTPGDLVQEEPESTTQDEGDQPFFVSAEPVADEVTEAPAGAEDDQPSEVASHPEVEEKLEPTNAAEDDFTLGATSDPPIEEALEPVSLENVPEPMAESTLPEPSIQGQPNEPIPLETVADLEPAPTRSDVPSTGLTEPAMVPPPSAEQEPPAPFEMFQKRFHLDPDGGQRAPITASMPNAGLKELLSRFAGASFNNGLYRIIDAKTVVDANAFIAAAYPEDVGKLCPFAFDWAGNIFAVDPRDPNGEVVLYDLGTSDVATMPLTVMAFHDDHLPQDSDDGLLSSQLYGQWLSSGGKAPLYSQCVEFKVPLFLNGSPDLQNMAVTDLEVYWHLTAQLIQQARALSPGTRIGTVTISD